MKKYLNQIPNIYRDNINIDLMQKTFDKSIIDYIVMAFKGLEILPNIKILDYQWRPFENEYDLNNHIIRRNVNKNKVIKNMLETRAGILYIDIEISGLNKNGDIEVHYRKKPLIIPIQDDDGYYMIKGKKCYLIYQLVDKMLYPSFSTVTIKSLMPICIKTEKKVITSTDNEEFIVSTYNIQIFKNAINVLLLYSNMMVSAMLNFLEVSTFIKVFQKGNYTKLENKYYFETNKKSDIVIEVDKEIFHKEIYIRSITGCLIKLFEDNEILYQNIDNWEEWMLIVGGKNTIKRGINQHIFFQRLLDDVSRMELKINPYDKQNIYYLLKWVLQNFHILWGKDNLAMDNKRLRCNEYLGSFITAEISKRINRIVSLGDKATIRDYMNMFNFPDNIFIIKLYTSGVLRYAETYSDMDFENFFKFTKKGPNSLGNNDFRRIPKRQRELHPSMLGYIDIAETSSSDPKKIWDTLRNCGKTFRALNTKSLW